MEWIGKFGNSVHVDGTTHIKVVVETDIDEVEVFIFPEQAREMAKELLKLADEIEKYRESLEE